MADERFRAARSMADERFPPTWIFVETSWKGKRARRKVGSGYAWRTFLTTEGEETHGKNQM
jgi:hypothetical protein